MAILRDHERASKAWGLVNKILPGNAAAYAALAKGAPVMILTNGLGQTLAFFLSKSNGKNEYALLYSHLDVWLSESCLSDSTGQLIEKVISQDSQSSRRTTEEALAFLSWIKRFASAKAPDEQEEQS